MAFLGRRVPARMALRTVPASQIGSRAVTAVARIRRRGPVLECGGCGAPVVRGFAPAELTGLLIRCTACGAVNESVA